MKKTFAISIAALLISSACAPKVELPFLGTLDPILSQPQGQRRPLPPQVKGAVPSDGISVAELFAETSVEGKRIVKVCGWATNAFESISITEKIDGGWKMGAIGFGVHWLDEEPRTRQPEWRCITGRLVPACGWENYPDNDCINTGFIHSWAIVQTQMGRE